jgi:hypothetical protein
VQLQPQDDKVVRVAVKDAVPVRSACP